MDDRDRRPDTSKNGRMKRHQLDLRREEIKERGRSVVSRLGKKKREKTDEPTT
ncbi:hypothetical protein [Brevibacillus sp. H7]|jgi:hypothetical protein|uniref:hypothetical protein n=1 Tax=Brevibacillus sp. H7 TaxID=3349138 RepID=UPI003807AF2A